MQDTTLTMNQNYEPRSRYSFLLELLFRAFIFAFFWWLLTEGDTASWVVGVPTTVAATCASFWLSAGRSGKLRLAGAIRFATFFLLQSLFARSLFAAVVFFISL